LILDFSNDSRNGHEENNEEDEEMAEEEAIAGGADPFDDEADEGNDDSGDFGDSYQQDDNDFNFINNPYIDACYPPADDVSNGQRPNMTNGDLGESFSVLMIQLLLAYSLY